MEWNMAGYHIRFQIYCNRMVFMMAMLWAQEIMSAATEEEAKALYARCPRLLKDKVKSLLVKSGFEEVVDNAE